ncbi:stage V sporulation protein D (sporulation-specific penicillin-binding protein) [Caldanaerobius fijiensis DSM 17918]|uniref:Stage V sporulation protein D (Sporulation-specific penicillin-binding protein) n=2 Tax=Caldanaerobius TaxID=862261 RepID=A0A1M4T304_9THEO|nr:stage V sporulation protein D (sporulation-specific penicillin-binding protein) [Caldanaerobius fijiensis DSM 17918]
MKVGILAKRRLVLMLLIVVLITSALSVRLGYIQMIKGPTYTKMAKDQWTLDVMVAPKRGTIYDRNGNELAVSVTAGKVSAIPREIRDPHGTAQVLSKLLELKEDEVYKKLTQNVQEVLLKRRVSEDIVKKLRELKLPGIEISNDTKRYYPEGRLLSHVLGFTGADNQGLDGVELIYDKYLKGIPGYISLPIDALGRKIDDQLTQYNKPKDGFSIVLTIDENIQKFTEKALEDAYTVNKPAKGITAIVMEPNTGEILALANKPDYDPNNPFEGDQNSLFKKWRDKAISDTYEPGSVFKTITAAAALDSGYVKPDDRFYDRGFVTVAGHQIKCWAWYAPHGSETFVEGVQNSCNVVFVETAQKMGSPVFYKYINAFGFGKPTNISLPGEATGIVTPLSKVGPVELATISFGQGISVTPLQMIDALSAIANGGNLMQPMLVKYIKDPDSGKIIKEFKPNVVRRVISSETSREMREILESVVSKGTGKKSYIPGYRVAGKTGTTEKYVPGKYVASFAGFAPADDPKIAVIVMIDEPTGEGHMGGAIAAPVVKSIIEDSLKYLGVKPRYTPEESKELVRGDIVIPDFTGMKVEDAKVKVIESKLTYKVDGIGDVVLDQSPKPGAYAKEGSTIFLYASKDIDSIVITIPDLIGKTLREALSELNSHGLKVSISGDGIVVAQDPPAGVQVKRGTIVHLTLKQQQQPIGP